MMLRTSTTPAALLALVLASGAAAQAGGTPAPAAAQPAAPGATPRPADSQVYAEAARRAWTFIDRSYVPATGLVKTSPSYAHATIWDVASGLIAHYSANKLGLLPDDEYDRRMRRALTTLKTLPLYRGAVFNRAYSAQTGAMIGNGDVPSDVGTGWSALDLGRFLSVLKVIASNQPQYSGDIDAIVRRIDMSRVVRGGYLWGEDRPRSGRTQSYTEGKIGYEQYAAQGFAVWGFRAEKALDVTANARPVSVLGVPILADKRGGDRLTTDPFVLAAMETGLWGKPFEDLARGVLAAQEARFRETGAITVVNEDALPVPPHYFYYYSVYRDGRPFVVDAQGPMRNVRVRPWVSTKGAFGWDAVFPSDYTRSALELVTQAHAGRSTWGSGVYEGTREVVGSGDVNSAAIILQAALYKRLGRRLMAEPPAGS